jgi:hypothetical protein
MEEQKELTDYDYSLRNIKQIHEIIRSYYVSQCVMDERDLRKIGELVHGLYYFHTNTQYSDNETKDKMEKEIAIVRKDISNLSKCFNIQSK